jgi:hypothetical protein
MNTGKARHGAAAAVGAALVVLGLVTIGLVSGGTADAAPLTLVDEPLAGASTATGNWSSGGSTCLTSSGLNSGSLPQCATDVDDDSLAHLDAAGSGALRLTSLVTGDAGLAFNNTVMDTSRGLSISFDQYQWGGTGGDGMTFFLMDGQSSATEPGADGGALGYADSGERIRDIVVGVNGTPVLDADGNPIFADWNPEEPALLNYVPGLAGAFAGVAFDSIGNFSNPVIGPIDHLGPGNSPNSVVIRGSQASYYGYVSGGAASQSLAFPSAQTRAQARIHVDITISTESIMSVVLTYPDGQVRTERQDIDLRTINGAQRLPATMKLGFSAGTGEAFQFNEINNLIVTTLAPDLELSASMTSGASDTDRDIVLAMPNLESAGSTDGPITVTGRLPEGVTATSAAGDGWNCTIAEAVTCTRQADGVAALSAGEAPPTIHLVLSGVTARRAAVVLAASVDLATDGDLSNNDVSVVLVDADPAAEPVTDPAPAIDSSQTEPDSTGTASAVSSGVRTAALGRSALASTGSADAGMFAVLADVFILSGFVLIVIGFRRSLRHSRPRR